MLAACVGVGLLRVRTERLPSETSNTDTNIQMEKAKPPNCGSNRVKMGDSSKGDPLQLG